MESFKNLRLSHWRQFLDVDIDFESNLCVLTGANGSGKTTILNVLGKHFGWNLQLLSGSLLSRDEKRVFADAWESLSSQSPDSTVVGTLTYTSGQISQLLAPAQKTIKYQLKHQNLQAVAGLHIPSHRPPPSYHAVQQIPIDPKSSQQHYTDYQNFLFATYNEQPQKNPATAMKETLIAFAVFGEGNSSVRSNSEYREVLVAFNAILGKLLPGHIGFQSIEIRAPEVFLKTATGDFALESMSGGLNALFGIAWQIHTYGFDKQGCTVLIDEPENHLHPSMQRELLPRLCEAFPSYRFIVASHSPFVVSSKPDAAVYALVYNDDQRVVSKRLHEADLAGSPNELLREILDVPVTMPIWVEARIEAVLAKFAGRAPDAEVVKQIREELSALGLANAIGDFLIQRREVTSQEPAKE